MEDYAKPPACLPKLKQIFDAIEKCTMTKFEAMDILNKYDILCEPILSMREIAEEQSLGNTVVEVDHPTRRQVPDRRQSDQDVGQHLEREAFTAARRAHR